MDKSKLVLPAIILTASIIVGGSILASQVIKQSSIEKQQTIKIAEDRRTEEAKNVKEQQAELEKRKAECQRLCDKRAMEDKEYWSGAMVFETYCKYDFVSAICYFSGGGKAIKDNYWERYIKNAETNQKLKIAWGADYVDKNERWTNYINDYWKEHEKIFGF